MGEPSLGHLHVGAPTPKESTSERAWGGSAAHRYDVQGIVTLTSEVALPELEMAKVDRLEGPPSVSVTLDRVPSGRPADDRLRYAELSGRGFAFEITLGDAIEVVASPLLRRSPHVLYTNVVEPILRWALVDRGYALVHGACLAVVWDDWGGFYDHVLPPPGYGFRLPALMISPWAKEGHVSHVLADHTSVLKFIADNFDLPPLSQRQQDAASLAGAFDFRSGPRPRPIFSMAELPSIPVSTPTQNRVTLWIYLICLGSAAGVGFTAAVRAARRTETALAATTE